MPFILMKLWDENDEKFYFWMPYGKETKKRKRPLPVRLSLWEIFCQNIRNYLNENYKNN